MKIGSNKYIGDFNKAKTISDTLINKIKGESSDDTVIEEWLHGAHNAAPTVERLSKEENIKQIFQEFAEIDDSHTQSMNKLMSRVSHHREKKSHRNLRRYTISVLSAAVAILVLSLLVKQDGSEAGFETNIIAGKNPTVRPTLILPDGKNVDLLSDQDIVTGDEKIISSGSKELTHKQMAKLYTANKTIEYNTLIIPNAFTYTITLSDSTVVTLNANSELIYPVHFSAESREVHLKGEAYFEVKKSSSPFIVNSHNMRVKVYGTKFNVKSSEKLNFTETSLIEGSVGVSNNGSRELMIKPYEKVSYDGNSHQTEINKFKNLDCIAWVSGVLKYTDVSADKILNDISLWYGVSFDSKVDISSTILTLDISKNTDIDDVVTFLNMILKNNTIIKKRGGAYEVI